MSSRPIVLHLVALAWVAIGIAPAARAETLYRCRDRHGVPVYQNEVCSGELRPAGVREYTPARIDPTLARQTQAARDALDRRYIEATRAARLGAVRRQHGKQTEDPCRSAKARRDSTLKRVGLHRTFDLLSQLDGDVWDACKGF